jgi:hypothetical protein
LTNPALDRLAQRLAQFGVPLAPGPLVEALALSPLLLEPLEDGSEGVRDLVFAVSPRKPMSPIWGCAQEAEQPEKCILTVSWPGSPTLRSISRAHSNALTLVSTMP